MKTIIIASQKGGSGKTMLAAHLAVEAERAGDTAWLIDTDRQATLSLWHERRKADTPQRLDVPFARIADGLATLAAKDADARLISAVTGEGVPELLASAAQRLPESPFLYPADEVSTQHLRFFVAELIRETALEQLSDEVPYSRAVLPRRL